MVSDVVMAFTYSTEESRLESRTVSTHDLPWVVGAGLSALVQAAVEAIEAADGD